MKNNFSILKMNYFTTCPVLGLVVEVQVFWCCFWLDH